MENRLLVLLEKPATCGFLSEEELTLLWDKQGWVSWFFDSLCPPDLLYDKLDKQCVGLSFLVEPAAVQAVTSMCQRFDEECVRLRSLQLGGDQSPYPAQCQSGTTFLEITWSAYRQLGYEVAQLSQAYWLFRSQPISEATAIGVVVQNLDDILAEFQFQFPTLSRAATLNIRNPALSPPNKNLDSGETENG
jgi:hypothetical protein